MKLIVSFFRISFLINLTYRFGLIMRLIRDFTTPLSFIILWSALYVGRNEIGGYTLSAIATYYILVKVIDQLYSYEPAKLLTREIRTGDLSNYLTKPLNYFKYLFGYTFGKRVARTTLTILSVVALGIFFPNILTFPPSIYAALTFTLIFSVSVILVFEITYLLGCLTFWISETDYLRGAVEQFTLVLGGLWVPITFFPKWLSNILEYLPFKYQYYFPVMVFQGKILPVEFFRGLFIETVWVIMLGIILSIVWRQGIKKYEGYGN